MLRGAVWIPLPSILERRHSFRRCGRPRHAQQKGEGTNAPDVDPVLHDRMSQIPESPHMKTRGLRIGNLAILAAAPYREKRDDDTDEIQLHEMLVFPLTALDLRSFSPLHIAE